VVLGLVDGYVEVVYLLVKDLYYVLTLGYSLLHH
jgi:hypothetical protein